MLKKLKVVLPLMFVLLLAGCSKIEEDYKPLYQAKPKKEAVQGQL